MPSSLLPPPPGSRESVGTTMLKVWKSDAASDRSSVTRKFFQILRK